MSPNSLAVNSMTVIMMIWMQQAWQPAHTYAAQRQTRQGGAKLAGQRQLQHQLVLMPVHLLTQQQRQGHPVARRPSTSASRSKNSSLPMELRRLSPAVVVVLLQRGS